MKVRIRTSLKKKEANSIKKKEATIHINLSIDGIQKVKVLNETVAS